MGVYASSFSRRGGHASFSRRALPLGLSCALREMWTAKSGSSWEDHETNASGITGAELLYLLSVNLHDRTTRVALAIERYIY
eukprot:scaffold2191_cov392-Prasinococcus_capsulatus_cf.AAC.10